MSVVAFPKREKKENPQKIGCGRVGEQRKVDNLLFNRLGKREKGALLDPSVFIPKPRKECKKGKSLGSNFNCTAPRTEVTEARKNM